jgi:hypothetical protein
MIKVRYQTYLIDKDSKLLFPEDNKELATYLCNHIKDIVYYMSQDWYEEYLQYEDYDDEVFYTLEYYGDGEYCLVTPDGFSDCYFYIKMDMSGKDLSGIDGWSYLGELNNNTYIYIK